MVQPLILNTARFVKERVTHIRLRDSELNFVQEKILPRKSRMYYFCFDKENIKKTL